MKNDKRMERWLSVGFACWLVLLSFAVGSRPAAARTPIDPDDAYKGHCVRCHTAMPTYSPRQNKTIMMHMRVAANIPGDEAKAILGYLNSNAPQPAAPKK